MIRYCTRALLETAQETGRRVLFSKLGETEPMHSFKLRLKRLRKEGIEPGYAILRETEPMHSFKLRLKRLRKQGIEPCFLITN